VLNIIVQCLTRKYQAFYTPVTTSDKKTPCGQLMRLNKQMTPTDIDELERILIESDELGTDEDMRTHMVSKRTSVYS